METVRDIRRHRFFGGVESALMTPFADTRSDEDLVVAAGVGDHQAFEVFYRRYLPPITAFLRRRCGRQDLALDLAAETFAAVVVSSTRFDPERGTAKGWLFGIASHKLSTALRAGRVESTARARLGLPVVSMTDADLERVDEMASLYPEGRLLTLLDVLPDVQRHAVLAHVVDDLTYAEIAANLRCSEAVVRKRVSRGLKTMRTRLEATR